MRVMAIDYGDQRIGLAVSDLLAFILSIPLTLTALRTMDRG